MKQIRRILILAFLLSVLLGCLTGSAQAANEYTISSPDDLPSLLADLADITGTIYVDYPSTDDFTVTSDLYIPRNVWLTIPNANLVVSGGATLTNEGSINVGQWGENAVGVTIEVDGCMQNHHSLECSSSMYIAGTLNCKGNMRIGDGLTVAKTGSFFNRGFVILEDYGRYGRNELTIDGIYRQTLVTEGYTPILWICYTEDIDAFLEDRALREAANPDVMQRYDLTIGIRDDRGYSPVAVEITEDITIPDDTSLNTHELTVAKGCQLTVLDCLFVRGPVRLEGTLRLEGTRVSSQISNPDHVVTLCPGGAFEGPGAFAIYKTSYDGTTCSTNDIWEKVLIGFDPTQFAVTEDSLGNIDVWTVKLKYGGTTACKHDNTTRNVIKNATCTEDGQQKWMCLDCGAERMETISALGHTSDGNKDCALATYCTTCSATLRAAGEHFWDGGVETIAPTYTTDGEKLFTCTSCGETRTEVIPSLISAGYVLDLKPYLNKNSQTAVTLKGAQYFTNKTKNNKAKKKTSSIPQELFVNSLTQTSLQKADDATKEVIREQIQNMLYNAKYRPGIFGSKESQRDDWPVQNDDYGKKDANGKKVYSVKDSGLGLRVRWSSYCAGCLSYGRFFSNYVYGCDGANEVSYLKSTEGDNNLTSASALRGKIQKLADPGETLYYSTKSTNAEKHKHNGSSCKRYHHAIVFLGESADGKGFYFASYNGGLSWGKELHGIYVGYFSYEKFYEVAYQLRICDTNKGSYYKGTAKTVSLSSNPGCGEIGTKTANAVLRAKCPIEMVITLDGEVLDSRLLENGQTGNASFGSMTASGDIGGDRTIEVQLMGPIEEYEYEVDIIGTGNGTMDLTILSTATENGAETETIERCFQNVPITGNTEISATGLSAQDAAELTISDFVDEAPVYTVWRTDETGIGFADSEADNFSPEVLPEMDQEPELFFTAKAVTRTNGNTIEADFTFDGEGSDEYSALAVVCFYEKGKFLRASMHEIEIVDSQASLTLTDNTAYDECKVFFVSDTDMDPISDAIVLS